MLLWLIYDISDNCIRTRTSEKCKDYGLSRIQKSAFFGDIKPEAVKDLSVTWMKMPLSQTLYHWLFSQNLSYIFWQNPGRLERIQ
ncbi:MAG: CRISPR-associated endonuclease Cas2 [Candidatus Methanoperedens sp.]|nr:CRISPR-associated endonuclease Cas2 [Candidatus Methanoperedens sp.]